MANAEADIEKLNEEKRETVQQMSDMQDKFEEMQDGFREEQSEEFTNLKRDLDDTAKNVRLFQFKLRKAKKRVDEAEAEKEELKMRLDRMKDVKKKKKSSVLTKAPSGEVKGFIHSLLVLVVLRVSVVL